MNENEVEDSILMALLESQSMRHKRIIGYVIAGWSASIVALSLALFRIMEVL